MILVHVELTFFVDEVITKIMKNQGSRQLDIVTPFKVEK